MNILAFETSGPLGSVSVGRNDGRLRVLARRFLERQSAHGSRLVPAIGEALAEAGLESRELDAVVVGAGPGSFTGLRVAAATAKGLARALGCSLYAVDSLAAGAMTAGLDLPDLGAPMVDFRDADRPRYVLFDARGSRIYGACYRVRNDEVEVLVAPHGGTIDDVLEAGPSTGTLFAGSGAREHWASLEDAGYRVLPEPAGDPIADGLLRIVAPDPSRFHVEDPARWEPTYLREWKPGWIREAG